MPKSAKKSHRVMSSTYSDSADPGERYATNKSQFWVSHASEVDGTDDAETVEKESDLDSVLLERDFRSVVQSLDVDGSGTISKREFYDALYVTQMSFKTSKENGNDYSFSAFGAAAAAAFEERDAVTSEELQDAFESVQEDTDIDMAQGIRLMAEVYRAALEFEFEWEPTFLAVLGVIIPVFNNLMTSQGLAIWNSKGRPMNSVGPYKEPWTFVFPFVSLLVLIFHERLPFPVFKEIVSQKYKGWTALAVATHYGSGVVLGLCVLWLQISDGYLTNDATVLGFMNLLIYLWVISNGLLTFGAARHMSRQGRLANARAYHGLALYPVLTPHETHQNARDVLDRLLKMNAATHWHAHGARLNNSRSEMLQTSMSTKKFGMSRVANMSFMAMCGLFVATLPTYIGRLGFEGSRSDFPTEERPADFVLLAAFIPAALACFARLTLTTGEDLKKVYQLLFTGTRLLTSLVSPSESATFSVPFLPVRSIHNIAAWLALREYVLHQYMVEDSARAQAMLGLLVLVLVILVPLVVILFIVGMVDMAIICVVLFLLGVNYTLFLIFTAMLINEERAKHADAFENQLYAESRALFVDTPVDASYFEMMRNDASAFSNIHQIVARQLSSKSGNLTLLGVPITRQTVLAARVVVTALLGVGVGFLPY